MATRLEISFPTIRNPQYRVYIDDSSYASSAVEVEAVDDGFTLTYDGDSNNILDPIKGSTLQFTIAVTDGTLADIESFATDLIGAAEGRFTIRVDSNTGAPLVADELFWCGYVLPDLSGFEDRVPPYGFRVTATDGLARLKGIDYSDDSGSPTVPYGNLSFLDHILNCLNEGELAALYYTGTDTFLRTSVNWVDDGMGGTPSQTKCPLEYSRAEGSVFSNQLETSNADEFDYLSCYDALKTILENWQCQILFSAGSYMIRQMGEIAQDTYYERRFATDGTLLSSSSAAGYNVSVPQTGLDVRLTGGVFNYLPALKKVTANWDHKSHINYLAAAAGKWITGSASSDTVTISNVTTDGNTYFLISGSVYMNLSLGDTYTVPWRYVIGLRVKKGSYYLTSNSYSVTNANGEYLQQVGMTPDPPIWDTPAEYYDISTDFITTTEHQKTYSFNIITDVPPTGQADISIIFNPINGYDLEENALLTPVLNEWKIIDPQFYIFDSNDPDTLYEIEREYVATNDSTGNSDQLEFDMTVGSNAPTWTPAKIETTTDLATWTHSDDTWQRGSGADAGEFGDLWAQQAMALQKVPVQTYSGTFYSDDVAAHSRIIMPDSTAWIMARVTFTARELMWQGEWIAAGVQESGITMLPPKKKGLRKKKLPNPFDPEIKASPGPWPGGATSTGLGTKKAELAMMLLTTNFVSTTVSSGSVTSIPVRESLNAAAYLAGDQIFTVNPSSGEVVSFEVSTTSSSGDTAISVVSKSISNDIPVGSNVVFSTMNRHTDTGGSPGTLPAPTNGAILRAASGQWSAYSGTTNGYVLTWNTGTSTWEEQASAAGSGDINDGGNSTAATIVIGTNDANSLSLETNNTVGWTMDTGQLITMNASNAATSTAVDRLTIQTNSTGTAAAGFGGAILFQGESSTTDNQDMARLAGVWTTATHASRAAKFSFQLGVSGGALQEVATISRVSSTGQFTIGDTVPLIITRNSITPQSSFNIGGTTALTLVSSSSSASALLLNPSNATNTSNRVQVGLTTATNTSGNKQTMAIVQAFGPTSGTGTLTSLYIANEINQTGGANGNTYGIQISPTFSAVGGTYYAIDIVANNASAKGVYQSGSSTTNNLVGSTAFGSTSAPSAKVDITGAGATSATHSLLISNSTPATVLAVRDDKRVGILTSAPGVTVDASSATDAIALPEGTTAQRPSVNDSIRMNSDADGLEVRYGGAWHRLTCQVAPSIAAGAAAGTGPTVSIDSGNDLCHQVSVTTGTSATTGTLCTVTFNQGLDAGLFTFVVFSARNANAAGSIAKFYIGSAGNTSYTIDCASAPADATQYTFHVMVKQ